MGGGVCAAVVTFIGVGWAVRLVEAMSLSSPKRPCKEAACMRRPQGAQEGGEATGLSQGQGEQRSPEMGALRGRVGGQVSSPPSKWENGAERKLGP